MTNSPDKMPIAVIHSTQRALLWLAWVRDTSCRRSSSPINCTCRRRAEEVWNTPLAMEARAPSSPVAR